MRYMPIYLYIACITVISETPQMYFALAGIGLVTLPWTYWAGYTEGMERET